MAYRPAVPQYQGNGGDFSNYYIDNENSYREKKTLRIKHVLTIKCIWLSTAQNVNSMLCETNLNTRNAKPERDGISRRGQHLLDDIQLPQDLMRDHKEGLGHYTGRRRRENWNYDIHHKNSYREKKERASFLNGVQATCQTTYNCGKWNIEI